MSTRASVHLLCIATAILLLGATVAGCRLHSWSQYSHIPYQRWRADDAARLELLREVARGCADKARRLSRGPGLYQLRMSKRWARKARIAQVAIGLLETSPQTPRPGCARILSKLRWKVDFHYVCAVGWITNMRLRSYLRSSSARRAGFRRRIQRFGYHCGPAGSFEGFFLRRLLQARACTTAGQPAAPAAPVPSVTPPPAPGHAPAPTPPRKKRRL